MNFKSVLAFVVFSTFLAQAGWLEQRKIHELQNMPEDRQNIPTLSLADGDLYFVFAHADDELSVLGLAKEWLKSHPVTSVHWILVSDGGAAHGSPMDRQGKTMAQIRAEEALKVTQCLGMQPPVFLNDPDGRVKEDVDLSTKLEKVFSEAEHVSAVVTHDSVGLYGHADHLAVRSAVEKAVQGKSIPIVAAALPKFFRKSLALKFMMLAHEMWPAYVSITHKLPQDEGDAAALICADKAYFSQRDLLVHFRRGLSQEDFYPALHFDFFHVDLL